MASLYHQRLLGLPARVSPFAFATPLTSVSIEPWVHHGQAHNASKVVVIVANDKRIDLMCLLRQVEAIIQDAFWNPTPMNHFLVYP